MKRGNVYQIGGSLPNVSWECQNPLAYVLDVDEGGIALLVAENGVRFEIDPTDRGTLEYRGNVHERDLQKIARRILRKGHP